MTYINFQDTNLETFPKNPIIFNLEREAFFNWNNKPKKTDSNYHVVNDQ